MEISHNIDFIFWIGTCLMVSLVLGFVILALTYQNHFFRMKKNEIDLLLKASLESEREERQRIAADMHDSILADLNAVNVYLSIVKNEGITDCYDELKLGIEQAIASTRQVSYKLMPPLLESLGLAVSVKDYFEKLTLKTNIEFIVAGDNALKIPLSKEYELFRVLQEITTNIIKHGKATHCQIAFDAESLSISIIDDGLPFDFDGSLKLSKGSGLKNITGRLRMIEAVLQRKEAISGNHYVVTIKK